MAFAGAHNVDASHSIFNEAGRDIINYNYQVINSSDPLKSDTVSADKDVSYQPMPCHNELFTGREDYLEKLRRFFVPRNESRPRRCFLLYGLGGAGKTQISLKFAEENSERFWRIFWVDASTAQTIELSLRDIATDPAARASGVECSAKSILQWLARIEHDWLIIFDNASGDHNVVAEYMPHGNRGNILFTSRNLSLARYVSREARIEVDNMGEEDAVSLLLKSALIDECSIQERQAARLIVKELCCLPLAIDQAGAAIASGLCNVDDYLHRYSQRRQMLLADPTFKGASNYGRAVYGTWDLSFTAINVMGTEAAESAIFILQTFAFFHHESIMEDIIKRAAEAKNPTSDSSTDASQNVCLPSQLLQLDQEGSWDPSFFREGICILLSFSLIKKAAIGGIYSLHPLVHCWSCDSMSHQERQTSCSLALILLSSSITFHFTSQDYAFRQALVPHINANKQCTTRMGIQTFYHDKQFSNFALAFYEAGLWKEAEELEVQVMQTRKRVLGVEHSDTLMSMGFLALIYQKKGWWKEAEELQVQAMQTRKRVFGEEHPDALTNIGNLGLTYQNQGRWKEAEELEVQVMQTRKRVFGEEHPDTLTSMGNLGLTYHQQGRWKEAEELEVQVMQIRKRVSGEEHPDTITSMGNLALTYQKQGRWKEAEELQVQVMQTRKRVSGEEHPETLTSMGNLGSTYHLQGQWKKTEELQVEVMQTRKRVSGEEHPDTLTSMGNLGLTYQKQERWKEAEELEVQVMQIRKRVFGEEHPETLTSMGNLASTYQNQGWWKKAEKLQVQVMQIRKRVLGEEHPDIVVSMGNLALTYQKQGQWKEAEELEVQVMQTRKRVFGGEHPDTLTSMGNLASTYWNQGLWKEAEELEVQVMQIRKRVLGEEHPSTVMSMENLALTYQKQGRWKEAEELEVQVLQTRKRVSGKEHLDTLTSMGNMALT